MWLKKKQQRVLVIRLSFFQRFYTCPSTACHTDDVFSSCVVLDYRTLDILNVDMWCKNPVKLNDSLFFIMIPSTVSLTEASRSVSLLWVSCRFMHSEFFGELYCSDVVVQISPDLSRFLIWFYVREINKISQNNFLNSPISCHWVRKLFSTSF